MTQYEKKIQERLDNGQIISYAHDKLFKKVFNDPNHISRVESLIAIYLDTSPEQLKGRVKLLPEEIPVSNKKSKKEVLDIVTEVTDSNGNISRINVEVNLTNSQSLKRNVAYSALVYGNGIKSAEDYEKLPNFIQLNFDAFEVNKNNPRVVKTYYLKDETNKVLTESFKIVHVNIVKCKDICYSKNIKNEPKRVHNLIRFGASLMAENEKELTKALGGVKNMSKKVKDEIVDAALEYSREVDNWLLLDPERDARARRNGEITKAKNEARAEGHAAGLIEGHATGLIEGRAEGRAEGELNKSYEIAKNLLKQNISLEIISQTTGLTLEELEKLNYKN